MTLKLITQVEEGVGTVSKSIVATTAEDYKILQELMHRATNLWPDAPAQAKRIADLVTNGKVLQDYGPDN
jgi:uncharacterized membrane-anchored protein YhcB (DUF1043 family)